MKLPFKLINVFPGLVLLISPIVLAQSNTEISRAEGAPETEETTVVTQAVIPAEDLTLEENPEKNPSADPTQVDIENDYAADVENQTSSRELPINPPNTAQDSAIQTPELSSQDDNAKSSARATIEPSIGSLQNNWGRIKVLGTKIKPGTRAELSWVAGQAFDGTAIKTPVVIIRGKDPGPTLCLTAAVHGDEVNGVEIVRRVVASIEPDGLAGTVIATPIVNLLGFERGSRYLPDRRDLNRYFPGQPRGSSASRIAYVFFKEVIRHCGMLVDMHTGSFKRTNLPQLRADLSIASIKSFVENFGATAVLNKPAGSGTLRGAAAKAGIPAVAFELGEPVTLQLENVEFGVKAIDTLMDKLGMIERFRLWSEPQPIFYESHWVRAQQGGILTSNLKVGLPIKKNQLLGIITNPLSNETSEVHSPFNGRLLGRALNQFVLPGFATFHIGIRADDDPISADAPEPDIADDEYPPNGEDSDDDLVEDNEIH